jgi:hypothetical protein
MQKAVTFFERHKVAYRIVGSIASMAYSEPRFTNDIDILVDLREDLVELFEQEFPSPEYYVSTDAVRSAIRDRRQFNVIHIPSGLKLDIIQCKDSEFGRLDISHGQRLKSDGFYDAWFASPENVILMKLRFFKEGGSDKHLRDTASILLVQGSRIDRDYISKWSKQLGVSDEWQLVCQRSDGEKPDSSATCS